MWTLDDIAIYNKSTEKPSANSDDKMFEYYITQFTSKLERKKIADKRPDSM